MGACAVLDCNTRARIKATTDIAGPGVLYAYIVSALLAVAAVAFGYLTDSLPAWYLNETDEAVIASFQRGLPSGQNVTPLVWICNKVKTILCFGRQSPPHRKLSRAQRQEVVTRFVLTLSDQQLATGLAILIAAAANQCTLSVWEFQLAFSLAWFSSTTHLATLDCLREYFLEHGAVHNWRVFGMICLLLLLMYSLIMNLASVDVTLPVSCTFKYFGDQGIYTKANLKIDDILSVSLTLVILTCQYVVRIRWSYKQNNDGAPFLERTLFSLRTRQLRKTLHPTKKELDIITEEAILEHDSTSRRRELDRIRRSEGPLRHWLVAWRASGTYSGSFLSLGPMLCFMISFGFTQLYINRWHSSAPVDIDNSMSVGQIMPLFLLVLPPLVAAESYYEIQEEPRSHTSAAMRLPGRHEHRRITSNSTSDTWTQQRTNADHDASETLDLEPLGPNHDSSTYEDCLPQLQKHFYLETKAIDEKEHALDSLGPDSTAERDAIDRLKTHMVSSSHILCEQEAALKVTTATALIEFTICSLVATTLGIFAYIEGASWWTTVTSYVLFTGVLIYEVSGFVAYVMLLRFSVGEEEYRRWMREAKTRLNEGYEEQGTKDEHL